MPILRSRRRPISRTRSSVGRWGRASARRKCKYRRISMARGTGPIAKANTAGARLELRPKVGSAADEEKSSPAVATPLVTPVFDPERLAVQSYSAEGGMGFIQGKN